MQILSVSELLVHRPRQAGVGVYHSSTGWILYIEIAHIGSVNEYLCTAETIINTKRESHPNNTTNTDIDKFS